MSPLPLPPVVASSSKDEAPPPASASAPPPPPVVASTSSSSESGESASNSEGESVSSASSSEDEAPPPVVASTASGSEKDESASGSEKDEAASGSEKDEARPPHPASAPAPSPPVLASTASGSDTASETETPPPQLALARSSVAASPGSSSTLRKRPHDSTDITTTKRKKVSQIVWSKQDEIELLQAVLNFRNKTGKNPSSHHKEIYDMAQAQGSSFLGGKTYAQFTSKVSVLKKKYVTMTNNKKTSTKAHGLHCWKLCMKIWVSSVGVCDDDWFESSDLLGDITSFGSFDEAYALEKWSLVPLEKKKELQDKWKDVLSHNLQGVKLRSELVSELTSAIHNA